MGDETTRARRYARLMPSEVRMDHDRLWMQDEIRATS
jgi:hypothetical protein